MDESSNSKRCRMVKTKFINNSNNSCTKSTINSSAYASITKLPLKLIAFIFDYLSLMDLVSCQQVNKLFNCKSIQAIESDESKYTMYYASRNNLDIDDLLLTCDSNKKYFGKDDNYDTKPDTNHDQTNVHAVSSLALIRLKIDKLVESANRLKNMLNTDAAVKYITQNLFSVVKHNEIFYGLTTLEQTRFYDDDDIHRYVVIEFPCNIVNTSHFFPCTKIFAKTLLDKAGIKYCEMENYLLGFKHNEAPWTRVIYNGLDFFHQQYYERILQREIMTIMLTNKKILKFFDLKRLEKNGTQKNLLLLDWDQTLYYGNIPRPHLIKFLQCVTKFCVIFIDTAGCGKESYISELNKNDGINISGVFNICREKNWFNKWIKRYHWCNIDPKYFNFLLIDDYYKTGTNLLNVPPFRNCRYTQHGYAYDDDVLLKLIPWLQQWYKYTTIDKQGTTNQFIKHHPISFTSL